VFVRTDIDLKDLFIPSMVSLVQHDFTQKIRLKNDQFCRMLMYYLRSVCRDDFGKDLPTLLLTKPVSIEYELYCLMYYNQIVKFLSKSLEKEKTLEDDQETLETCKDWSFRMALLYRSGKKKILRNQLDLVKYIISVVESVDLPPE
jgi:hypothetical protein